MAAFWVLLVFGALVAANDEHQPLSRISIHRSAVRLQSSASITASPQVLGLKGVNVDNVRVIFQMPIGASSSDWIGVFSPSNFSSKLCLSDQLGEEPRLCNAPIKYQFANMSDSQYAMSGRGELTFRLINQRQDFAFGLFSGYLDKVNLLFFNDPTVAFFCMQPVLVAVSQPVAFKNPKAPVSPRLALGKDWNEMTVTWTSGYSISEAKPFVLWGPEDEKYAFRAPASTLTFTQKDMCGAPANTVGWRDPGYIHTSYLKNLWPSTTYFYKIAHKLKSGDTVYGPENHFMSSPAPGQDSLQRVVIFGDMGKGERDLSNEYSDYQPGALNTTDRLNEDLDNIDMVFHIGDITYSDGYLSQWDQFTEQIERISSRVPYMIASGNHERDWPLSGSFYNVTDSGGECGVPAQTVFNMPAKNRAKFWYSADYGMFRFCVADSENDWQEGSEQYKFIEECLSSVDRQKQPWLIFIAHRVLGYSSGWFYATQGTFAEAMARDTFQKLWQKYKVDLAFYGHLHHYERTCTVYQNQCVGKETENYSGKFNATIHLVVGGAGAHLADFTPINTTWSLVRDRDYGFGKLTAFDHSTLLFEYKKSSSGDVYDKFWIKREYMDVLGCDTLRNCPEVALGR
ncbi:nucleotide pyrophosphatase/phosphodiesterase isoform X2 [Selaginella moellendorffii]|uniref:nucleotide pyrophosphatase/phosphodiesterase isoform X2 n=1 Tax=Selaginella moellendorffii TaxID=88036 RepID=UPI000D1CA7A6|nr:nucleotide pyrophosphatase/phosphodiesterase isoform X2 [Selaginella moellendorffii]|eukprot:XP_024542153.1 nucleotide pyrophosphatase/phosphodiesterase isoform X2 [Selaginella moellendorffii]